MSIRFHFIIVILLFASNVFAQQINQTFFDQADAFFKQNVNNGLVNYTNLKNSQDLNALVALIENADLSSASEATKKAFYINAYNIHVINEVVKGYPIKSVQNIPGFFDRNKVTTAGEIFTLTNLEKKRLLDVYQDARLHFVLVCGALDCPPITNFAYQPDLLEAQLDRQTQLAFDNPDFLRIDKNNLELSQIFKWYPSDFGGNRQNIIQFINQHKTYAVPTTAKLSYYTYDWALNEKKSATSAISPPNAPNGNNTARYVVSSTIPKGSFETKIFNNLYTQKTGSQDQLTNRSTFFTTAVSFLYGLNNRFNIGFNTRYRRVRNSALPSGVFNVFGSGEAGSTRHGITAFGPQIRYAPVEKWTNFSIQSSFVFAIGKDLAGSATQPYIDWNGATWNTQLFNDFPIGNNFSLFTEIDVLLEDIGSSSKGHLNRLSTPATLILSYNPNRKTTIYALGGYSPYWQSEFDYFVQAGIGAKYQFTPKVELELLATDFSNKFLSNSGGQAATYNLGLRVNF